MKTQMDILEEAAPRSSRSMLHNETTTFEGKHFQVERRPRVPQGPSKNPSETLDSRYRREGVSSPWSARYADGWNATYIPDAAFESKNRLLDRLCEAEGRDPSEIVRSCNVGFYMGADEQSAQRKRREFEEKWGRGEAGPDDANYDKDRDYLSEFEQGMIFGTAKDAIERLGALQDAGADQVNISVRAPFDWEGLQAFVEDVIPAFS